MAVVKLAKSKRSVQFIDDEGNVFFTSVNFLQGLLLGKSKHDFVLLKRMPLKASADRFQKSEVWIPEGVDPRTVQDSTEDALSETSRKKQDETKKFVDKQVW